MEVAMVEAAVEDTTVAGAAMAVAEEGEAAHMHGRGPWVLIRYAMVPKTGLSHSQLHAGGCYHPACLVQLTW